MKYARRIVGHKIAYVPTICVGITPQFNPRRHTQKRTKVCVFPCRTLTDKDHGANKVGIPPCFSPSHPTKDRSITRRCRPIAGMRAPPPPPPLFASRHVTPFFFARFSVFPPPALLSPSGVHSPQQPSTTSFNPSRLLGYSGVCSAIGACACAKRKRERPSPNLARGQQQAAKESNPENVKRSVNYGRHPACRRVNMVSIHDRCRRALPVSCGRTRASAAARLARGHVGMHTHPRVSFVQFERRQPDVVFVFFC